MFTTDLNNGYISVNYHSDFDCVEFFNAGAAAFSDANKVQHCSTLGGYEYPILDWVSSQLENCSYQILKCERPADDEQTHLLRETLEDPHTLYGYPDGNKVTIVQFENWDNTSRHLDDLGIDVLTNPKMFKRIKTLNRCFRSFYSTDETVKVMVIGDLDHTSYPEFIAEEDAEKLFDGAFIISPNIVGKCMEQFDTNTTVFDDEHTFSCDDFNRNTEVGQYYRDSKIFNARIFGPMEVLNEGEYSDQVGAIKGQAYTDHSGICDYYGVDVVVPFSAFKKEVNFSSRSFFLIEPQNAKLGQMYSDAQTIVNLPALYDWHPMRDFMRDYYSDMYSRLTSNKVLDQWTDMSFAHFNPDSPKMFDATDVNALTTWNVRAWLTCGGKLSNSPWLFEQMGKNLLESMRVNDARKLRFPVPAAARALVITESLLRAIKGLYKEDESLFHVDLGTARWDNDLSVLVVNDLDYIEMYPSHGGCDLDDFFMIHWRTVGGEKKVIVARSPNDWGEYSVFNYVEGDWNSVTTYGGTTISFPSVSANPDLWPERLSEVLEDNRVTYEGLPDTAAAHQGNDFNADYILNAIESSSAAASSVGINVNARQLWSDTMRSHREHQVCSMEDAIDAGVQGGTDAQIDAVIEEGGKILDEIIASNTPIDSYLWTTKHADYNKDVEVETYQGNVTYLNAVRNKYAEEFKSNYEAFGAGIADRSDYSTIHGLGARYLTEASALLRGWRRNVATINNNRGFISPEDWEVINDTLLITVEGYEPGHERNSFVISLYSACISIPTSSGKKTDQLVMQPLLFPFLLEALQFYGVLGRLETNDQNSLDRTYDGPWVVNHSQTNNRIELQDAVDFQSWYFKTKIIHTQTMEA